MDDKTKLYEEFGEQLRKHRRRLNLSQERLGARVRLSRTSITNIESGRQKILLHQLFALAEALDVNPQALLPSVRPAAPASEIEGKLPKGLSHKEKEWVHRVMAVPSDSARN